MTALVATGAVLVAAGAVVFGAAAPRGVFEEVLGAAAGAGAVEICGAGAGVVAAGVLGVAGVAGVLVAGVSAGGANTAAPAVPGSTRARVISRHRADRADLDMDTDAWVMEIERIVLRAWRA